MNGASQLFGLHDYNRMIRDIATSADWQSGRLACASVHDNASPP
jgi:hypothetical protein